MSTAIVIFKRGYTERHPGVDHFRIDNTDLILYVDHEPTTIDLELVESFDFLPDTAHAI